MTEKTPTLVISDQEYRIHHRPRFLRGALGPEVPTNFFSGEPAQDFIDLADACRREGMGVAPYGQLVQLLDSGRFAVKFGPSVIGDDLALLRNHPSRSEWNAFNLEKVEAWSDYFQLGRDVWALDLTLPEHRDFLRDLFKDRGPLAVKSRAKGFAAIYQNYTHLLNAIGGDIHMLKPQNSAIIAAQLLNFADIHALRPNGQGLACADLWRHYVYAGKLIHSSHAFDCDPKGTENSGREANVARATDVIAALAKSNFASSYVLDTGTLADGTIAAIEVNHLFASAIYGGEALNAIAKALAHKN